MAAATFLGSLTLNLQCYHAPDMHFYIYKLYNNHTKVK